MSLSAQFSRVERRLRSLARSYEDEQLGSEGYEQPRPDADEEPHLRPLTKHQMAFVSPRLGVLDNSAFPPPASCPAPSS